MTGSIVCGIDGSRDARVALRVAVQLSGQLGLRLVVAHIAKTAVRSRGLSPARGMPLVMSPLEAEIDAGEELLEGILLEEGLAEAEGMVAYGPPAKRLADLADEQQAELIVVGSRGRGAFKAAFLGSVSNDVMGVARCPVLVVPPGAAARAVDAEKTRSSIGSRTDGSRPLHHDRRFVVRACRRSGWRARTRRPWLPYPTPRQASPPATTLTPPPRVNPEP